MAIKKILKKILCINILLWKRNIKEKAEYIANFLCDFHLLV